MTSMRPLSLVPDGDAFDGLARIVKRALGFDLRGVGADERDAEVDDRSALQDITDATQDAVDLSVCAETIAVNQWQALRLLDQFFVRHEIPRVRNASGVSSTTGSRARHKTDGDETHFFHSCAELPS